MAPAHMFADGTILGFRQLIVVGMSRATLGLLNHQFIQQLRHGLVDEFSAVIGVKTVNDEGKLGQQSD